MNEHLLSLRAVIGILILGVWGISAASSCDAGDSIRTNSLASIDAALRDTYPSDAPGASIIVTRGDRILLREAYGLAHAEHDVGLQPDMTFRIASLTKQFTAIAILILVEEGLLDLDDTVETHLPDYPGAGAQATIEQLLSHTSGIFNYTELPGFFGTIRNPISVDALIDSFDDQALDFEPGGGWKYSNSGYVLLGAIIETVSGKTYGEFVTEHIFRPLQLASTVYPSDTGFVPGQVSGYAVSENGFRRADYLSMTIPYASGSIESSVDDLCRWHRALKAGELIDTTRLARAWSNGTKNDGSEIPYGFGWFVGELEDMTYIHHDGGILGFQSYTLYLPEPDVFVAILSNLQGGADLKRLAESAALAAANGRHEIEEFDTRK